MALHSFRVLPGRHPLVAMEPGSLMSLEEDLRIVWEAVETCECPEWAVGQSDAIAAALERIARAARAEKFSDESHHMCKDANLEWVPCPPDLCEADKLLAEFDWRPKVES